MRAKTEERRMNERRTGPDPLIKLTWSISKLSWMIVLFLVIFSWILISSILLIDYVSQTPFSNNNTDRNILGLPSDWYSLVMNYTYYLFIAVFVICAFGLILNSFRHSRKSDTYNRSLIVLSIISIIGIIAHLFFIR
jgi:hypothetical protein